MRNYGSNPTLINCTFLGNSGDSGGGILNHENSNPILINCSFSGNKTSNGYGGGGVSNDKSNPYLINCTFSGNYADTNSTTSIGGGGLFNNSNSIATLVNCIFWGNNTDTDIDIARKQIDNINDSKANVSYSCVQGGYGGVDNIASNPNFVNPLGLDNILGTLDDNLRLLLGSPCIDKGDNSALPSDITKDLDSNQRIVNGTVDMGAYEFQQ